MPEEITLGTFRRRLKMESVRELQQSLNMKRLYTSEHKFTENEVSNKGTNIR
jgi:hypothetical protein